MKNKWKELREEREAEAIAEAKQNVDNESTEARQTVEETKAAEAAKADEEAEVVNAGVTVKEVCHDLFREYVAYFGMNAEGEVKELLDKMSSVIDEDELDIDVFKELSDKLDSLKTKAVLDASKKSETKSTTPTKAEAKKAEVKAVPKAEQGTLKTSHATSTKSKTNAEGVSGKAEPRHAKKNESDRVMKHAKPTERYDAKIDSIMRSINIAAASGNSVEVLRLAEKLADATGTVSFCTMKALGGKKVLLLSQGLENVPNGKKILNFYSGLTSQTASGQPRRFATYSRSVFEELTGKSADKAEIIKVVVKDKKPSHTPPLLEDYL